MSTNPYSVIDNLTFHESVELLRGAAGEGRLVVSVADEKMNDRIQKVLPDDVTCDNASTEIVQIRAKFVTDGVQARAAVALIWQLHHHVIVLAESSIIYWGTQSEPGHPWVTGFDVYRPQYLIPEAIKKYARTEVLRRRPRPTEEKEQL